MLALWGSGGIKAGECTPPARASAFTKKCSCGSCAVHFGSKSELPTAVLSSPPPPRCSHSNFFSQIAQGCSHSNFFFSASAPARKVAVAAVPCTLAQKVSFPLLSCGPPPPRCSHSNFFLKMRKAAATVVEVAVFLKNLSKINTFASKIAF